MGFGPYGHSCWRFIRARVGSHGLLEYLFPPLPPAGNPIALTVIVKSRESREEKSKMFPSRKKNVTDGNLYNPATMIVGLL